MKKISIFHENPQEAEKIGKILAENGYIIGNEDDADMFLYCRDSVRRLTSYKNPGTPGPEKFTVGGLSIDFPSRTVITSGKKVHLTPIEFRIITLLAKYQGVVLTHEQIINEIWGPFNNDSLLLRVNIANIRKKIEPDPAAPRYILTETGVGYYLSQPRQKCELTKC